MKQQPQNQASGASETTRFFVPRFRLRRVPQASYAQPEERSQTWPKEIRIPASAKVSIPELCTTPSPRARVRVREDGTPRSEAALAEWRTKTFGGDFDPVREAVEDAVNAFSYRQPEDDSRIFTNLL